MSIIPPYNASCFPTLLVRDINASIEWYMRVLDFEVESGFDSVDFEVESGSDSDSTPYSTVVYLARAIDQDLVLATISSDSAPPDGPLGLGVTLNFRVQED